MSRNECLQSEVSTEHPAGTDGGQASEQVEETEERMRQLGRKSPLEYLNEMLQRYKDRVCRIRKETFLDPSHQRNISFRIRFTVRICGNMYEGN